MNVLWFGVFMGLVARLRESCHRWGFCRMSSMASRKTEVNLGTNIPITDVFCGVFWFVLVSIIFVVVVVFLPDIALWLPQHGSNGP